ncbi:hypothetical protein NQZ68_026723 [Dissostichus eleginoides]|nr:hypothetical protein NQZ68_026723 [Dissostichus eleginoides]
MAMESASASVVAAVAMEMPVVRGALPVVEEDEGYRAPPGSEERLRYRRGGRGRRRRGVPFNRSGHYMLIVVGEIGTEQQLDAVRAHIDRGECLRKPGCVSAEVICVEPSSQQQLLVSVRSLEFWDVEQQVKHVAVTMSRGPLGRIRLKAGDTPTY